MKLKHYPKFVRWYWNTRIKHPALMALSPSYRGDRWIYEFYLAQERKEIETLMKTLE